MIYKISKNKKNNKMIDIQKINSVSCDEIKKRSYIKGLKGEEFKNHNKNLVKERNKRYYEKKKEQENKHKATLRRLNDLNITVEEFADALYMIINQIADSIVALAQHKKNGNIDTYNTNMRKLNVELLHLEVMWGFEISDCLDNINKEIKKYGYKTSYVNMGGDIPKHFTLVPLC